MPQLARSVLSLLACKRFSAFCVLQGNLTVTSNDPDTGFDLRTFECVMCDYTEEVAVKTNMMGWINCRELRPPN